MAYSSLLRLSGISAIIGGLIVLLMYPVRMAYCPPLSGGTGCVVFKGTFVLESILVLLGIVGIYLIQAEKTGIYGLISFFIAFLGGAMTVGADWTHTFVEPALQELLPDLAQSNSPPPFFVMLGLMSSWLLHTLGWILFGISIISARVFSKWAVLLVIVGFILSFIPLPSIPVASTLAGLGLVWLGYQIQANARKLRNQQVVPEVTGAENSI